MVKRVGKKKTKNKTVDRTISRHETSGVLVICLDHARHARVREAAARRPPRAPAASNKTSHPFCAGAVV